MILQDKYISLLTDFGFKRVFGTDLNKDLLIDFLKTLLPPYHQIQDLSFKNNENLGTTPIDRKAILETHRDKWLFLLRHLAELTDRPDLLQDSIFSQLFEVAEIANFSRAEQDGYQDSLKYYRDMNNVVNTSRQEGKKEGIELGRLREQSLIFRLLTRRIGVVPDHLINRIQALTIEQLEILAEDLLDFGTLDDLTNWLD
jgi:hypothetical protein